MVTDGDDCKLGHLFIEEWMQELKLNDETLGLRMGKSRTTIWRWRTEQHRLNPQKLAALAKAMKIAPEDFWRPPGRPSLDAILRNASDDLVREAAEVLKILAKRAA